jgi:hypothetical protein
MQIMVVMTSERIKERMPELKGKKKGSNEVLPHQGKISLWKLANDMNMCPRLFLF